MKVCHGPVPHHTSLFPLAACTLLIRANISRRAVRGEEVEPLFKQAALMSDLKLKLAFWDYDRTSALANGAVKLDGVDATFQSATLSRRSSSATFGIVSSMLRNLG